ncbi:oligopeptide ABC transporter permease OppB [Aureimonas phyllosphaerae]|uniref:Oligopeptide transport system permease protein n=1 Tax=Aureimonas phyllosphaerae TaxID=1166078 RepID=A0A7W6FUE7_9HYPH|nr:oligopeptide ABC transporter permease OppB [Aureimonas phyllosphaerae]MBB3935715.1 oligopeptide transport system permease protein [Aureimonas phyllosphaerae]MBB3959723.1 oligopeptide transport system permease protein [Aureimonas phyllosphaerae]SFF14219.1 oligopeptide transport system permease protein [Aureimonas phyllosphaerae]
MIRFVFGRLLSAVPTLFIVVTISFFLMRAAPGGPFNLERPLPPATMANLMATYQLDQPLVVQYATYLSNVVHGDFGPSFIYRDYSVSELILQALPYSVTLGLWALAFAVIGGTIAGVVAALRQNGWVDYLVMGIATVGITVPNFVIGPVLTLIFAITLSLVPAGGWGDGSLRNLVLPVIALGLPQLAVFARLTRGSMIEAMRTDHVRTAKAYGLPWRSVVVTHAMRGAMLPAVTYLAPCCAALLTGSTVVETLFTIPGVGRYFVEGALNRDYTLVMGTVVLISVFIIAFNLLVDLLYAFLDPRIRHD